MEASQENLQTHRILVAEDSPTQRRIIMSLLAGEGHEVLLASDGIEAVTQAFQEAPDLVILDIEMPKMNGYQVCRLLKDDSRTAHIPIIMLTSKAQETDKFWGLKTGADRYVTKSFKLTGLAATVQELLDSGAPCRALTVPGSLGAGQPQPDDRDIDVLSRVNELLDRKLYEATIINEISKLNTLSEDCGITLSSMLTVLAKVIECHVCAVFLIDETELFIHVHNQVGRRYFDEARRRILEAASPLMRPGASPSQIKSSIDSEPALVREDDDQSESVKSMLTLELKARGQTIAQLSLTSPAADAFTDESLELMKIIEYPVSLVVDNARLHESTRKLAITDGLTRLYNHRHFYELLDQEFLRAIRYESKLSLIMIDIDSFKLINDTHGHQMGDEILMALAGVISREVRDVDIAARYGGEELAVLLPQTGIRQAAAVAERIRAAVENQDFSLPEGSTVTISLGVSGFPDCGASNYTALVQVADAALYEAKKAGKNCVRTGRCRGTA